MKNRLLEILVCPESKAPLVHDRAAGELKCKASGLAYPIRDGIPVLLVDEARRMSEAEREAVAAPDGAGDG